MFIFCGSQSHGKAFRKDVWSTRGPTYKCHQFTIVTSTTSTTISDSANVTSVSSLMSRITPNPGTNQSQSGVHTSVVMVHWEGDGQDQPFSPVSFEPFSLKHLPG